ncbi:MAG: haloalkane dehalogenase [Gammaproteobacteria bacterium]
MSISSFEHPKRHARILGSNMAWVELGQAQPESPCFVFQHGNPTSSYLWRNIMPHFSQMGRCIAPDLIGMGDSEKLPDSGADRYRFVEHRKYFDALLEHLGVRENVILVIHDWGSALGFDWARRHPQSVRGIVYMEAIVQPIADWSQWPENARPIFQGFRSPAGEDMVLDKNIFVERVLPGSVLRELSEAEMTVYRRPFQESGESRRPTLTWPREIPISGQPEDVTRIVSEYSAWMAQNQIPKLFINADPGAILTGEPRNFCRTWPNQQEVTVSGSHFIQEDSPDAIAKAIADWFATIQK